MKSLQSIVEQALTGLGFELVDVEFVARGMLRVFIDRPGERFGPTVDDCELASRQLSRVFEVEGIDYSRLEVSSPGLDRPLKRVADFERFTGDEVAVRLRLPVEGRRQFQGVLSAAGEGRWAIEWSDAPPAPARGARRNARGATSRPATAARAGAAPAAAEASDRGATGASTHRVEFSFDDVERARLVPRIEFAGVTGR